MPAPSLALPSSLVRKIASIQPDRLARAAGFRCRTAKKVTPAGFLLTACLFGLQSCASLSAFAQLWSLLHGQTLSKQAVHKRCSTAAVTFLERVLQAVLLSLLPPGPTDPGPAKFGRILIQDSTHLALPKRLAHLFPGPANQNSQKQAALKIQATFDLRQNQWLKFALTPFTCNDQAAAPLILPDLRPHDLVIRDLGYLVLPVLREIQQAGAYFLSRWRHGLVVACPNSGARLELPRLFGRHACWEGQVLLGREKLPVRLIALRLPENVAAERRRKARANRDLRLRPDRQHLHLLGWNIFITNVPQPLASASQLVKLYGLRWRIETIFKSWKSHFQLHNFTQGSAEQVLLAVLGKLLWISWFSVHFTRLLALDQKVSLLKLAAWWSKFALILFHPGQHPPPNLGQLILYHCRYEKRQRRTNFLQKCAALS